MPPVSFWWPAGVWLPAPDQRVPDDVTAAAVRIRNGARDTLLVIIHPT